MDVDSSSFLLLESAERIKWRVSKESINVDHMIPQKAFSFESAFESAKKNVEMVKTVPKKHLQDFQVSMCAFCLLTCTPQNPQASSA
jgi:hypothetical protein